MLSTALNVHAAFCLSLPLSFNGLAQCSRVNRLSTLMPSQRSKSTCEKPGIGFNTIFAKWQQSFLPPDPSLPALHYLYENFPTKFRQAFLLGVDTEDTTVFITAHDQLFKRRPAYATSSFALPLPLPPPSRRAAKLLRDFFSYTYATPSLDTQSFIISNASSVTSLLPASLCRHLSIDHIVANDLARTVQALPTSPSNRISSVLALLAVSKARVGGAAILDAPSLSSADSISLVGVLYLEKWIANLYGERVFSDAEPVAVDAHFAVAIANAIECPCFIQEDIFSRVSVRIQDMVDVYSSYGHRAIKTDDQRIEQGFPESVERKKEFTEDPVIGELWLLTADDVLSLSDKQLCEALRREGVAVRNNESRQSLLGKIVEFMDEVHRREVGIKLAADQEMYDVAAELQKGRSRRGQLLAEIRQAEQQGNWSQVTRLAAEMKHIEARTHDITLEPGSYDPDLDQDDWYRPCR